MKRERAPRAAGSCPFVGLTADADTAVRFGLSLPAGFGTDYAGVVDQVGDGVTGFAPGDRVFGGALSRAVADFVVIDPTGDIAANEDGGGRALAHVGQGSGPVAVDATRWYWVDAPGGQAAHVMAAEKRGCCPAGGEGR